MKEQGIATLGGPCLPGPEMLGKTLTTAYERVFSWSGTWNNCSSMSNLGRFRSKCWPETWRFSRKRWLVVGQIEAILSHPGEPRSTAKL